VVKRSELEWLCLFSEQVSSGMTVRGFCRDRGLCSKHFGFRKKQLGWVGEGVPPTVSGSGLASPLPSPFVRVEKAALKETPGERAVTSGLIQGVTLRLGRCEWELRDVSMDCLTYLMVALG